MTRFIAALGLACLAGSAVADVTYTYTGRPLSIEGPSSGDPALEHAPLRIVLDFASDGSALLGWSLSQPAMGTISPANVFTSPKTGMIGESPAIYFYTDARGAVSAWYIGAEVLDPAAPPGSDFFSQSVQSWCGVVLGMPPLPYGLYAEEGVLGGASSFNGFNANDPGTWTASGGVLQNFAFGDRADLTTLARPVPEPATGLLLLAALGALAARRRKHAGVAS